MQRRRVQEREETKVVHVKKKKEKRKEDSRRIFWRRVSEKEKEVQEGIRNTHFIPFCPR